MFTREELISELPRLTALGPLQLEVVEFGHQDFTSPCSEQAIWAFRGAKQEFSSAMLFWIETLLEQCDWVDRESRFIGYAEAGLCEPICQKEFAKIVTEYSGSLQQPLPQFLVHLEGFRSGLKMYADWNDIGIVAELAESFVAFYWGTTA